MKNYTVLVGRPDYVSDYQLTDMYHAWVEAPTVVSAQQAAKRVAVLADNNDVALNENQILGEMANYIAVFVCEGHVNNIMKEEEEAE